MAYEVLCSKSWKKITDLLVYCLTCINFLNIIINSKITISLDKNQPHVQAEFRKNCSTIDCIQMIIQLIEKKWKEYYICMKFIDYEKVF